MGYNIQNHWYGALTLSVGADFILLFRCTRQKEQESKSVKITDIVFQIDIPGEY